MSMATKTSGLQEGNRSMWAPKLIAFTAVGAAAALAYRAVLVACHTGQEKFRCGKLYILRCLVGSFIDELFVILSMRCCSSIGTIIVLHLGSTIVRCAACDGGC